MIKYFTVCISSLTFTFAAQNDIQRPYSSSDAEETRVKALAHLKEASDARDTLSDAREEKTLIVQPAMSNPQKPLPTDQSMNTSEPKTESTPSPHKTSAKPQQQDEIKPLNALKPPRAAKCACPHEMPNRSPQKTQTHYPKNLIYIKESL